MVQNPRETPGPGALRPLNLPVPVVVEVDAQQQPMALSNLGRGWSRGQDRRLEIESIDGTWKIDEEWWREKPILRMYYQVTTRDGRRLTIFQDLSDGQWYRQRG